MKTIQKKKKCKRAKWLSEEALKIAEKRRKMKGEEKIYIYIYVAECSIAKNSKEK